MAENGLPYYALRTKTFSAEIEKNGVRRSASVMIEATIGDPPKPPILYAYMKSKYALADLLNLRLKTSEADKTNDAFEFAWKIVSSNPLYRHLIPQESKKNQSRYQKEYAETLKIVCFGDSCENDLLWAHYADNHAGVCLGIDLNLECDGEDVVRSVRYNGPVEIDIMRTKNSDADLNLFKEVLRTKEKSWEGEHEWRAILNRGHSRIQIGKDEKFYLTLVPDEIKRVVFGMHCPYVAIGKLGLACMLNGISAEFFKIKANYETHRLEPIKISGNDMREYMHMALLSEESDNSTNKG